MRRLRTDWTSRALAARRHRANLAVVDERDLGNRPGIERVFGLDGPEWAIDGAVVQPVTAFRALALQWLTREAS